MAQADRQTPTYGVRSSLLARAGMTACFIVTSALLISGLLESMQPSTPNAAAGLFKPINAAALK